MTRHRSLDTDARLRAQFLEAIICVALMAGIGFIVAYAF